MSLGAWLALSVVLAVVVYQAMAAWFRPKYAVTVQKTTNANDMPEVVTVQASLGRGADYRALFHAISDAADAAWARMYHVNVQILERNQELAAEIAARKAVQPTLAVAVSQRQRRNVAKALGVPLHTVTDAMAREELAKTNGAESAG